MLVHSMQNQAASLILEGVFEEFPNLRVVLIEGGFSWMPALAWRLDALWTRLRKEVPQVRRPPSEYIREHVWYTTQPMDDIEMPQHMKQMFDWVGWDRLLFASDYPHWDNDDVRYAFKFSMSEEQKAQIFRENAARVYNLDR